MSALRRGSGNALDTPADRPPLFVGIVKAMDVFTVIGAHPIYHFMFVLIVACLWVASAVLKEERSSSHQTPPRSTPAAALDTLGHRLQPLALLERDVVQWLPPVPHRSATIRDACSASRDADAALGLGMAA